MYQSLTLWIADIFVLISFSCVSISLSSSASLVSFAIRAFVVSISFFASSDVSRSLIASLVASSVSCVNSFHFLSFDFSSSSFFISSLSCFTFSNNLSLLASMVSFLVVSVVSMSVPSVLALISIVGSSLFGMSNAAFIDHILVTSFTFFPDVLSISAPS